jgi:hypothetical protein
LRNNTAIGHKKWAINLGEHTDHGFNQIFFRRSILD